MPRLIPGPDGFALVSLTDTTAVIPSAGLSDSGGGVAGRQNPTGGADYRISNVTRAWLDSKPAARGSRLYGVAKSPSSSSTDLWDSGRRVEDGTIGPGAG